jgi:hypothetical protein
VLQPIVHDSAHVFGRDPCHRRKVTPLDLVMDENPPGAAVFAEKLRKLEQRSRQAGFYGQKAGGGQRLIGLPQARCQNRYKIIADFRILARVFLEILAADETQFAIPDGKNRSDLGRPSMMASSPAISPGPMIATIRSSPRAEVMTTLSNPRSSR